MESEVATQTSTPSPPPDPESAEPSNTTKSHHTPRFGTIIPNRIFVGGIDFKTNENDLRRFFSQHGAVKEVKIVTDRAGVSKGYGFVTFETQDDAQKVLHEADGFNFRDKRLNIGQAIRKQQVVMQSNSFSVSSPNHAMAVPAQCGTMYLTTPTGYPYTYHNGVAYFHSPEIKSLASHWRSHSRSVSGSPVMLTHPPQPVYQQPAYHHYQPPAQCVPPGHLQWNIPQSAVPSSPVMYMQPSELLYQPIEPPADSSCVQAALPLLETTIPEQFVDPLVQSYHQLYAQSPGGLAPIIMQQDPGKEQKFHALQGGAAISLKPRYGRSPHYTYLHKDYRPDITDHALLPISEPLK